VSVPSHPLPHIDDSQLWDLFARAEEIGLRLEMTEAGITWEALPGYRHQRMSVDIASTIRPIKSGSGCGCFWAPDVAIRFRDGQVKRPDISIFCQEPSEEEGFIHSVPTAVIEITSPGYEDKDLVAGPHIYLRNGVQDVLVLNRNSMEVHHWTQTGRRMVLSPQQFELASGCEVTI
jgi:Uma2 family endonuclease